MAKFFSREERKKMLMNEPFKRTTVSMYRYVKISDPVKFRGEIEEAFDMLGVLGRTYVASEGINAQISVPEYNWDMFVDYLNSKKQLKNIPLKIAVEDDGKSFYKNTVKVRDKIVADGLDDDAFDTTNVGQHLSAAQWNEALESGATVVDMRNHYESEVGHFEGAITPDCDTFREELPMVLDELKGKEDEKVLLYCTGGVRCEKASAYLKHHGFKDVNQLHGGIIDYKRQIDREGLESKFKGKNFVFDERLGERITDDIISECHQCGSACDTHTNCKNDDCHLLFIQCDSCAKKMEGCCSSKCKEIAALPEEKQREMRKGAAKTGDTLSVYKSRLRPNLKDLQSA